MRVVALGLALAVCAARPADAGTILYVTAASQNRVLGFCVAKNGALAPQPAVSTEVATKELRRLLVREFTGMDGVVSRTLYVAGIDRVEAYRIGNAGGLTRMGSTDILTDMSPRDLELSPDRKVLYVPQRNVGRIVGYGLADDGQIMLESGEFPFATCVQGDIGIGYHSLFVSAPQPRELLQPCPTTTSTTLTTPTTSTSSTTSPVPTTTSTTTPFYSLVYASAVGLGVVEVYAIDEKGMFFDCRNVPVPTTACKAKNERSDATTPFSYRDRLARPKTVLVDNGMLYVEERARRQITAFQLMPDGNFAAPTPAGKKGKQLKPQPISSRTKQVVGYEDLVFGSNPPPVDENDDGKVDPPPRQTTLIGAGFVRGRIDSYRLADAPKTLHHQPTRTSKQDLRMTPVRMTVDGKVLYVAAGQRNRVVAYRLREDGVLADTEPFSTTEDQEDSFLNDVALATIPDGCN